MSPPPSLPKWYSQFRSISRLRPENRGNIAAVLVVLNRLRHDPQLRSQLKEILEQIPNELWRGWAALSLIVTEGEGQIADVTHDKVTEVLAEFGIAARYIGPDGGRSSRGNFRHVRQLLGVFSADRIAGQAISEELQTAQAAIIDELVSPALEDNFISVDFSTPQSVESVIADILQKAALIRAAGGVAQHLVGAKLARRFAPDPIDNFSVFASDRQLHRNGDFFHGHQAFHVTIVKRPLPKLHQRLADNHADDFQPTVLVPRSAVAAYQAVAREFNARLRSIEEFVGDNLLEMGNNDRSQTRHQLEELIKLYNQRVRQVERGNSGLEIRLTEN
jgi:hypothetical protein